MKKKSRSRPKHNATRSVLRQPDLEHSKTAVLKGLTSPDAQRGYRHAIDEFVDRYCSEPRLALNRKVVLRQSPPSTGIAVPPACPAGFQFSLF